MCTRADVEIGSRRAGGCGLPPRRTAAGRSAGLLLGMLARGASLLFPALAAAAPVPTAESPSVDVRYDAEARRTTLRVAAKDGVVPWADILAGMARAKGFEADVLAGTVPDRVLDLRARGSRVGLSALDLVLAPAIRFSIERDAAGAPIALEAVLDERALLATSRRIKERLRLAAAALASDRVPQERFGLAFDEGWQRAAIERPLVVLVHGLHSRPERIASILDDIRGRGLPCAALRYPNDQPIASSARLLARELAAVAAAQPERRVALLTTSMGGLVARAVIEDPALDPRNVTRLIMVAPPTHGSRLASFAFALEWHEQLTDAKERSAVERFYGAIEDGLGEAGGDLAPGSPFLQELNARPRNPRVAYTIFLGTGAPLEAPALEWMRYGAGAAAQRSRLARFLGPKVDACLADLQEVVHGKGDGAVAVARGRLEGVADTVLLEFDHVAMLGDSPQPGVRKLREEVLERLAP